MASLDDEDGWEEASMDDEDTQKDALRSLMGGEIRNLQRERTPEYLEALNEKSEATQKTADRASLLEQFSKAASQAGAIDGKTSQSALSGMGESTRANLGDYLSRQQKAEAGDEKRSANLMKIMGYLSAKQRSNLVPTKFEKGGKSMIQFVNKDTGTIQGAPIELGDAPKKERALSTQTITDENGRQFLVSIDPMTGNIVKKQDMGMSAKAAKEKEPSQSQFKAGGFARRMEQAEAVFQELAKEGYNPTGVGSYASSWLPENLQPGQMQQINQAKRNFITAALRPESGAAISDSEFARDDKKYFPQPGDSKKVVEQKSALRKQVMAELKAEAGPAYAKIPSITIERNASPGSGTAIAGPGKQIVNKERNKKTGKIRITYSDGTTEIQ